MNSGMRDTSMWAFGELRSLLHGDAQGSAESWEDLVTIVSVIEDPSELELCLRYCDDHLKSWPDSLRRCPEEWMRSWDDPRLELVRRVVFDGTSIETTMLREILASPHLESWKELEFRHNGLGPRSSRILARCERLKNLEVLRFFRNRLEPDGVASLSRSRNFPSLRSVTMSAVRMLDEGALAMGKSHWLSQLTELRLELEQLGSVPASLLLSRLDASRLERLEWRLSGFARSACDTFRAREYPSLRALHLVGESIGKVELSFLLEGLRSSRPRELGIATCLLETASLGRMLAEDCTAELQVLDLSGNRLDASACRMLTHHASTRSLRELNLGDNPLDAAGVESLARSHRFEMLTSLNLRQCECTSAGALSLARSEGFAALEHLDLANNQIGKRGMRALFEGRAFPALRELNVRGNPVYYRELENLARDSPLSERCRILT